MSPSEPPATNVELISHHLPKTAGTSLFRSLEDAFGAERVLGVYEPAESARLTGGETLQVDQDIRVIHGHFRPHANHRRQFPHAVRIIWVRDPIDRCWSLLGQWLRYRHGAAYERFAARHMGHSTDRAELFDRLVRDRDFDDVVNVYRAYLSGCDPADLDFVGRTEALADELSRLAALLGTELRVFNENVDTTRQQFPLDRERYAPFFAADYEFLATQLGQTYVAD